jgi:GTP pyrophosphokinase
MRTLSVMRPEKQVQKSKETLDIYAPIAHRLGISKIKSEFEDLALKYLNPNVYYDLAAKIAQSKKDRQQYIDDVIKIL